MTATAEDYVSPHVGIARPLLTEAVEELVEQYLSNNPEHDPLAYKDGNENDVWSFHPDDFDTVLIKANDGVTIELDLRQLNDGRLTASVAEGGPKMKFKPVDYLNSASGNGSVEAIDYLW